VALPQRKVLPGCFLLFLVEYLMMSFPVVLQQDLLFFHLQILSQALFYQALAMIVNNSSISSPCPCFKLS